MAASVLAAVVAKLAGLGLPAKATLGVGVALGAVGALPAAGVVGPPDEVVVDVGGTTDDVGSEAGASDLGGSVADDARDGGVDGQEVSARAHERNAERAAERDAARRERAVERDAARAERDAERD
ncbi:hypothetical protein, partial [Actinotalea ferrariae]|uniref:hypothetical protein n=1 Tax=Actinotalea ferrariae TaxID=1386098 RepID=UPI0005509493